MRIVRINLLFIFFCLHLCSTCFADKKQYKIGSDSILEGYYSIGLKVCRLLKDIDKNVDCHVIPTTGSIENLQKLKDGEFDFAFVQQNFALDAYNATGLFSGQEEMKELRQLLRLHDDIFTVIVKDDDHILTFENLEGKKISNGSPLSDSSATYNELLSYYNFQNPPADIEVLHEVYAQKFCKGEIDAIILMTGHPNALVSHITNSCDSEFLHINHDNIEKLIGMNSSFKQARLHSQYYQNISMDQDTVAVPAIFVTTNKLDMEVAKKLLEMIRSDISNFRSSHPVLDGLSDEYFQQGFVLPSLLNVNNIEKK